jgi:hypothetical protein
MVDGEDEKQAIFSERRSLFSLSNAHRFISRLKYFPLLCQ